VNRSRLATALLLFGISGPSALADTLISTMGPYTWTDACGQQMQITVNVYNNVTGLPGLYRWDYAIYNISVTSNNLVIGTPDPNVNGVATVVLFSPTALPDVANGYASANWSFNYSSGDAIDPVSDPAAGGSLAAFSNYGSDPIDGSQPIYSAQPGQTIHFGFTTLPRQVEVLQACDQAVDAACGMAVRGSTNFLDYYENAARRPRLGAGGRRATPATTICQGPDTYFNLITGPVAIPGQVSGPQAVDPVPDLLTGNDILQDPESLATLGTPVTGITADGAARLVLRAPAANTGDMVTLTLFNDQNAQSSSSVDDGTLASIDGTIVSSQIQVTAVSTNEGPMAFALYFPPTDFVRENNTNDTTIYQRPLSVQIQDNQTGGGPTDVPRRHQDQSSQPPGQSSVPFLAWRRLVFLVHGLWEAPPTSSRSRALSIPFPSVVQTRALPRRTTVFRQPYRRPSPRRSQP
jgi:hypothetical protein